MKGIVFTEFVEWADAQFSPEIVEQVIADCQLPSGGAYTAVGTYEHVELIEIVQRLSGCVQQEVSDVVRNFGEHLFHRFSVAYPRFFQGVDNAFEFLEKVQNFIHVEVLKLYPDAQLPWFENRRLGPGSLELEYYSERPLADLAHGLILGCIAYFGEPIDLERENLGASSGNAVRFSLRSTSEVLQCR